MKVVNAKDVGRKVVASVVILAYLSAIGCATKSQDIPPAFVSAQSYEGKNCAELRSELRQVNSELAVMSAEQDSTASKDTVSFWIGMLLLWPITFVPLFTDDQQPAIAELKGRQQALDSAVTSKCLPGADESSAVTEQP